MNNIVEIDYLKENDYLNEDIMEEIHLETLRILKNKGVLVLNKNALKILEKSSGVIIKENVVRFSEDIINYAINNSPSSIKVKYRKNCSNAMILEEKNSYFGPGSDTIYVLDYKNGARRLAVLDDIVESVLVADSLDNIDFLMSMGLPSDVKKEIADIINFYIMISNSDKPVIFTAWNIKNLQSIVNIAGDEKNSIICYAEPISPLKHSVEALDKLIFCAENNIPCVYGCPTILGATSPIALLSGVTMSCALILSGLVISQLTKKGAPFISNMHTNPLDFRTLVQPYCSPEGRLTWIICYELARRKYKLPKWAAAGFTDSKSLDLQAGIEASQTLTLDMIYGGNLIHDVGYMESGLTYSLQLLVICNEIIDELKRIFGEIKTSSDIFRYKLIKETEIGKSFMDNLDTLTNYNKEVWYPELIDRNNYQAWEKMGKKDINQRASEKISSILSSKKSTIKDNIYEYRLNNELKKMGIYEYLEKNV